MKRFTFLLFTVLLFSTVALAQRVAQQNGFLIGTQNGSVLEAKPYDAGFIYLANDGINDVVGVSANGQSFSVVETLELGSAARLSGWAGDNTAFYFGINPNDGTELDLRRVSAGTASLHFDQSGGHDPSFPAIGSVVRLQQGADGLKYYYPYRGDFDMLLGYAFRMYESDGTDLGTFETTVQDNGDPFNPAPITMNLTGRLLNENFFEGVAFNNHLFFLTTSNASSYPVSQITYVDYNASGSTLRPLYIDDNLSTELTNLTATNTYLYANYYFDNQAGNDRGGLKAIDVNGNVMAVTDGTGNVTVTDDRPVAYGDRLFVVTEDFGSTVEKLAIVKSPTEVEYIHINGVNEDDAISHLTISGNRLFFFATKNGTNTRTLYTIRADVDNPTPVEGPTAYEGYVVSAVDVVEGGIVYATWNANEKFGFVYITEGFGSTAYQGVHEGLNYGWKHITQIVANGNEIFLFEENVDGVTSAVTTEVYRLTHTPASATKPNPVPYSTFYRGNFIMTVKDSETSANLQGATVTINNYLDDPFTATSNANGQAMYAWKPVAYYQYRVSAPGYQSVEYDQWATIWIPDELYNPYGSRTVTLVPDGATGIENDAIKGLRVYPNPMVSHLTITADQAIASVELYNLTGAKVKAVKSDNVSVVELAELPKGVYLVKITDATGAVVTQKVTKK